MTQLSYQQAMKLVHIQQQEIERLTTLAESREAALHALGRETRGAILLNWHLVNEQGGEVRVASKTLVEISPDAKFGYRFDPVRDEYIFTARIEKAPEPELIVVPPTAATEPVVEATYDVTGELPYTGPELTTEVQPPAEEHDAPDPMSRMKDEDIV